MSIVESIVGLDCFMKEDAAIQFVLKLFREWQGRWLMVFDNYDDPRAFSNIRDFMPEGNQGCILVTSRNADSESLASDEDNAMELPGLCEPAALELLQTYARRRAFDPGVDYPHAKSIVQRLAYHPLAITQAGSYIHQHKFKTVRQFLDVYDAEKGRILRHNLEFSVYRKRLELSEEEICLNVFTTWELSFQQLLSMEYGQAKSEMLTLFAFFDSKDISEEYFAAYCERAQDHKCYV